MPMRQNSGAACEPRAGKMPSISLSAAARRWVAGGSKPAPPELCGGEATGAGKPLCGAGGARKSPENQEKNSRPGPGEKGRAVGRLRAKTHTERRRQP